jgi:hypothetical protein
VLPYLDEAIRSKVTVAEESIGTCGTDPREELDTLLTRP